MQLTVTEKQNAYFKFCHRMIKVWVLLTSIVKKDNHGIEFTNVISVQFQERSLLHKNICNSRILLPSNHRKMKIVLYNIRKLNSNLLNVKINCNL